jgi:glycosyltransferase involved in cell wall biosynthesis
MKIIYINDQIFPNKDTDAEQIMQTVSALFENGVDIEVLLPEKWNEKKRLTIETLEQYYQIKFNCKLGLIKSCFPFLRFFEKYGHAFASLFYKNIKNADLIYTRNLPTVIAFVLFSQKPVIYETFRNWPDQLFFMKPFFRWLNKRKNFLGAILHSSFAMQSYLKIGIPKEKLLTAHNGYNPSHILPRISKTDARKQLNLPLNKKIVVYSGNVSVKKGIGIILDMAKTLNNVLFIIVGSKNQGEIEIAAKKINNVTIIGWQKFKATIPYLYAGDVLIIPPTTGPLKKVGNTVLPIKTFLYLATGRAIFAPKSPDLIELLENNKNAILVEPDNLENSINVLKELLENDEKIEKIGKNALEMSKDLTYFNRTKKILNFIEKRLENYGKNNE